jgi:hypothetical protein
MMSGAGTAWKPFLLIHRISKCDTASQWRAAQARPLRSKSHALRKALTFFAAGRGHTRALPGYKR